MENKMSKADKILVGIIVILLSCLLIFLYRMQKSEVSEREMKKAVEEQKQKDLIETEKYKSLYDSIVQENKTERRIISIIDKAIKKNLNENTYNKQRAINAPDSVKQLIADSLLGAR